jgi:hypothetical protein
LSDKFESLRVEAVVSYIQILSCLPEGSSYIGKTIDSLAGHKATGIRIKRGCDSSEKSVLLMLIKNNKSNKCVNNNNNKSNANGVLHNVVHKITKLFFTLKMSYSCAVHN